MVNDRSMESDMTSGSAEYLLYLKILEVVSELSRYMTLIWEGLPY